MLARWIRECARVLTAVLALGACSGFVHAGDGCGEWQITPVPIPDGATSMRIADIHAIASDDVWAVGWYNMTIDGTPQTFAFSMHWDGATWSLVPTPQPAECDVCHEVTLRAVHASGPNDVWAAGWQEISGPPFGFIGLHILVMHWDGESWEVMDTPVQSGASGDFLADVIAFAPNDVWFFGENLYSDYPLLLDLAIALHWDGSSFTFTEVPIVNFQSGGFADGNSLRAASALAPNDIWTVGAGGDGDSIPCDLSQIHHWNGNEWEHVPADAPDDCFWHDLNAVEAIAPDDVWAGGDLFSDTYHPLLLHFDGASWSQVDAPLGVFDIAAVASDDVYGFGSGIMHWNGKAWTVVETFPEVDGAVLITADIVGPCDIWAGGRQLGELGAIMPFMAHLVPADPAEPGDVDGDGDVDFDDFSQLLASWGEPGCGGSLPCSADIDGDGDVDFDDFTTLLANWS